MGNKWRAKRAAELKELWHQNPNKLLELYYSLSPVIDTDEPSLSRVIAAILDRENSGVRPDSPAQLSEPFELASSLTLYPCQLVRAVNGASNTFG